MYRCLGLNLRCLPIFGLAYMVKGGNKSPNNMLVYK